LERATDAAERRRINTVGARNVRLRFAVAKPLNGFFARARGEFRKLRANWSHVI
jgi:hypothetical protein